MLRSVRVLDSLVTNQLPRSRATGSGLETPSNQVSIIHHHQQRTPVDVGGPIDPGQARPSAGSTPRDLASGRRGQRLMNRA
jgi:hypothetical protein